MGGEERFHASFGARRIKDLVRDPRYQVLCKAGPAEAQKAVDKWYPHALDTFGSAGSKFSELAVGYGIRKRGNEGVRQMWRKDLLVIERLEVRFVMRSDGRNE